MCKSTRASYSMENSMVIILLIFKGHLQENKFKSTYIFKEYLKLVVRLMKCLSDAIRTKKLQVHL